MLSHLLLSISLASSQAGPQVREPKVLMIGIDGVRPDALVAANTPNLDSLAQRGILTLKGSTTPITSSGPAWSSILTGTRTLLHGVVDNSFKGNDLAQWPTWLGRLESARPEVFTAAISQWAPIHEQLTKDQVDHSRAAESGAEVTRQARELLLDESKALGGLFLHYDDVDHAGHSKGYSVKQAEYIQAIEAVDHEVGRVLEALRGRSTAKQENWLILVGTDHGGKGTSHGQNIPACRTVFQLACRDLGPQPKWSRPPETVDFASLALAHLGLESSHIASIRESWTWDRQQNLNRRFEKIGTKEARTIFFGDSIVQGWDSTGRTAWRKVIGRERAVFVGTGGDRSEHLLWRMRHGSLRKLNPEISVILIGSNNATLNDASEIARGVQAVVAELLTKLPQTRVLLLATFPRGASAQDPIRKVINESNRILESWSSELERVEFLNINKVFLNDQGELSTDIMPDLLHPNSEGYRRWARAMKEPLMRILKGSK